MKITKNLSKILLRNFPQILYCRNCCSLVEAVKEAEKVVGYSTFLSRMFQSQELSHVNINIRKLMEIDHPLLAIARKLSAGSINHIPTWSLVILLVSQSFGVNSKYLKDDIMYINSSSRSVLESQHALAKAAEMIHVGNMIHKNVKRLESNKENDVHLGNQVAILTGDRLLSRSFQELAQMTNSYVVELMASSLRDLIDLDFIELTNVDGIILPTRPINSESQTIIEITDKFTCQPYNASEILGHPIPEWTLRSILSGGSLLARSCQSALILAHHSEEVQRIGFSIGKNFALAWQAKIDQDPFSSGESGRFSLVSAPIMVHLAYYPRLYSKIEKGENIDYESLRKEIQNGPGLEGTKRLQEHFCSIVLQELNKLPKTNARVAFENIINNM